MIGLLTDKQKEKEVDLVHRLLAPLDIEKTSYPVSLSPLTAKVIIFDIYGTLLSSAAGDVGTDFVAQNTTSFQQALVDGGLIRPSDELAEEGTRLIEEEIKLAHGMSKQQGIRFPEVDILQIWKGVLLQLGYGARDIFQVRLLALSYECRTNPVWPMEGLAPFFQALSGKGISLGILSNAQFYTPILLETLLGQPLERLGFYLDLVIWSYRAGEGKPSPRLFKQMNRRLSNIGVEPHEVVYVGNDMLKDVWPASVAGWQTILFAGDTRSFRLRQEDERIVGVEADRVINDLCQLVQILT